MVDSPYKHKKPGSQRESGFFAFQER